MECSPEQEEPLPVKDEVLSLEEVAECERSARLYIERDDFDIEITKVPQITEYFRAFKGMITQKTEVY